MRALLGSWLALLVLGAVPAAAQIQVQGGELPGQPHDQATRQIDAILPEVRETARRLGLESAAGIRPAFDRGRAVKLDMPLRVKPSARNYSGYGHGNYVDLDPSAGIRDFSCAAASYNGHQGIDYGMAPDTWGMMDAGDVEVVAAAPGVLVQRADGHYDRNCEINSLPSNFAIVLQDDGLYAFYWHLKKGSVTTKPIGSRIVRGELLGLVGSSGSSTAPHLHFELRETQGAAPGVDPYAGLCGAQKSLWKHQHETVHTEIFRVATHSAVPESGTSGCNRPDPKFADTFAPGSVVWAAVYIRNQRSDTPVPIQIVRPDGSIYAEWGGAAPPAGTIYPYAWWIVGWGLPADATGFWKMRAMLEGRAYEHTFGVGVAVPAATPVRARVEPLARSVRTGIARSVTVVASNPGVRDAVGCWVALDGMIAAVTTFQMLDGAGLPVGGINENFTIPAGGARNISLRLAPKAGYTSAGADIPVRIRCLNSHAPGPFPGYNRLTLSFEGAAKPDVVPKPVLDANEVVLDGPAGAKNVIVTTRNFGGAGVLTVRARAVRALPVALKICEVNPATGACIVAPAPSVVRNMMAAEAARWRVYVRATGDILPDELRNRVVFEFVDDRGIVVGATGFAVRTQ